MIRLGILPAIALLYYIYRLDRVEKEPMGLIVRLFLLGGVTIFGAMIVERILGSILLSIFGSDTSLLYQILFNLLVIALTEEGFKFLVLRTVTWWRQEFNFRFDAVVYAAAVSLGFAAFENVAYIFSFGGGVIIARALTAIPLHCIAGVFMGHYYGEAKFAAVRIQPDKSNWYLLMSILIPVLIHGFYDLVATLESGMLTIVFLVYIIVLDIIAIKCVKRYAAEDAPIHDVQWW